jgi:hypothetical protein
VSKPVFSFAHVERALSQMHDIRDDRAAAFQARLKHYQKRGFPPGINTGRGKAASYSIDHVLKLALAVEFNEMGLSPERAADLCTENLDRIQSAVSLATYSWMQDSRLPMFLYFDPSGLADLKAAAWDDADRTFHYAGLGQLKEDMQYWHKNAVQRIAIVNLTAMLIYLVAYLHGSTSYSEQEIVDAIATWAGDHTHDQ